MTKMIGAHRNVAGGMMRLRDVLGHHQPRGVGSAALRRKEIAEHAASAEAPAAICVTERCRVCGCTDADCRKCIEKTGEPCHWVEADLCSACQTV